MGIPFLLQSNPLNPAGQSHFLWVPVNGVPSFLQTSSSARAETTKQILQH